MTGWRRCCQVWSRFHTERAKRQVQTNPFIVYVLSGESSTPCPNYFVICFESNTKNERKKRGLWFQVKYMKWKTGHRTDYLVRFTCPVWEAVWEIIQNKESRAVVVLCNFLLTNYKDCCKSALHKTDFMLRVLCFRSVFNALQVLKLWKPQWRDPRETFSNSPQKRCILALPSPRLCMCI